MNQDLSIVQLVLHASVVVQLVMALLLSGVRGQLGGYLSQTVCTQARSTLNEAFRKEFWSGTSPSELLTSAHAPRAAGRADGAHICQRYAREYHKLRERHAHDTH